MTDLPSTTSLVQRLKSRQLVLLAAIAEHRSLRRAAAALNTTQPAATKLLQDLEELIGHPLFERHRRGLVPNDFGEVMIRHARSVIGDFERVREEIADLANGRAGHVAIGAVPSAVPFFVTRAVLRLKQQQPRLGVLVQVATSDHLVAALGRGELDVLVARRWDTSEPQNFLYEGEIDEPLVVAARPDHPLIRAGRRLEWRDLAEWPWVLLPASSPMRQVLRGLFREAGIERPADLVETGSMMMIVTLLAESDALAVIPQDVMRSQLGATLLTQVPVTVPPVMGAYGILTRRDRPPSAATRTFLVALRSVIAETAAASPDTPADG